MASLRLVAISLALLLGCRVVLPFNNCANFAGGGSCSYGQRRQKHAVVNKKVSTSSSRNLVQMAANDNRSADITGAFARVFDNPGRSLVFSILMIASGAILGPFLDSFHSAFGVLQYDVPITAQLWGPDLEHPALITAWWVPELFGLAGFLIGWLYIILDKLISGESLDNAPSPPKILVGISLFTFQYWLSGAMSQLDVDRTVILNVMSLIAAGAFWALDGSKAGFIVSAMTALGGPAIEVGLLTMASQIHIGGYHYNDLGETGFFPLWIIPVYFLGGPANGNLAKGYWFLLSRERTVAEGGDNTLSRALPGCTECNDTRCTPCPNCDGIGSYAAMGGRTVTCTSCRSRGFVVCRSCFSFYNEDPQDIEAIRELMSRMPD